MQGASASAPSSAVLDGLKEAHNLRRRGLEKSSKDELEKGSTGELEKGSRGELEKGAKGEPKKGSKFPGLHDPTSGEAQNLRSSSVGAILPSGKGSKIQGLQFPNAPSRVVGDSGEGACHDASPAVLGSSPNPETRDLRSDSDLEKGFALHNFTGKENEFKSFLAMRFTTQNVLYWQY